MNTTGHNITAQSELLRIAIAHTFQRRAGAGLLAGRNALLPTESETPVTQDSQFDLVTWLVILGDER